MDRRRPARRQGHHPQAQATGAGDRTCPARPICRNSRAWKTSRATSITPRSIPAPTPIAARRPSSSAPTIPPTTSAPHFGKPAPTSPWCSARRTHIVRSDTLMEIGLGSLYSEQAVQNGMTTAKADLIFASLPYRILHEFQIPAYAEMKKRDAEFYKRPGKGRLHARLGRRRVRPVHEVSAARLGLLHRRRRFRADRRWRDQAEERRRRRRDHGAFGVCSATAPNCRPISSSMPPAMAR